MLMVWRHYIDRLPGFGSFSARIQGLSRKAFRFGDLSPRFRSAALMTIWLGLSVSTGGWAYRQTQADTLKAWQNDHPPSTELWVAATRTLGLYPLSDPSGERAVFKILPSWSDGREDAWWSPTRFWLVVQTDPSGQKFPLIFAPPGHHEIPRDWESLGEGWDGLEQALAQLKGK